MTDTQKAELRTLIRSHALERVGGSTKSYFESGIVPDDLCEDEGAWAVVRDALVELSREIREKVKP